ncbi:MAG: hypothetical protein H8D23_38855 [Candidatus Brocadiales bacterium]|nr:hypothetical protein [Candidatus Brocadiales bacterium]
MKDFRLSELADKKVVVIGELVQEGVTTKIKALGYGYKQKRLVRSTSKNWISTLNLLTDLRVSDNLVAVFVHLTEDLLFQCAEDEYQEIWRELVDEILKSESIFFVYESNLEGSYGQFAYQKKENFDVEKAKQAIQRLFESNALILPYRSRLDLTLSIQEFLEDLENGVLLRLYVPNRQYQEDQLASFLRLLENYLQNIEKVSFSVDLRKTDKGHIYEFKSKVDLQNDTDLDEAIARFEAFMEICQNEPEQARKILENASIAQSEMDFLLSKYIREYRRLNLDIHHEREQKMLFLKQRLESDLLEGKIVNADEIIPISSPSALLSIPNNVSSVSVAIGQIFYGDVSYSSNDKQLLELFENHADKLEAITLKSSLDELKDVSSKNEKRETARKKIKGFLYKVAPIIGESVVKGLAKYLESLLAAGF